MIGSSVNSLNVDQRQVPARSGSPHSGRILSPSNDQYSAQEPQRLVVVGISGIVCSLRLKQVAGSHEGWVFFGLRYEQIGLTLGFRDPLARQIEVCRLDLNANEATAQAGARDAGCATAHKWIKDGSIRF